MRRHTGEKRAPGSRIAGAGAGDDGPAGTSGRPWLPSLRSAARELTESSERVILA